MFHLRTVSRQRFAAGAFGVALAAGPLTAADAGAQYSLISVAHDGGNANRESEGPAISPDGRFVAFQSEATNLVANDANGWQDVFVRDRQTNVTTRVSVSSAGAEAAGASESARITPDGRFVVFVSYAALVADDTNSCNRPVGFPTCGDIYVHDRQDNTTTRVSVSSAGVQTDRHSSNPSISADGRYVVFHSPGGNLVAGDTNGSTDVFLHDRQTNTTTRVSVNSEGAQMPFGGNTPLISADGELIIFSGYLSPGEGGDPANCEQATSTCVAIFQRNRATGETTVLSNSLSINFLTPEFHVTTLRPRDMSADGRFVVLDQTGFLLDVTPGKSSRVRSLLHDRLTNRTTSTPFSGGFGSTERWTRAISGDGRVLAHVWGVSPFNSLELFTWSDQISGFSQIVSAAPNSIPSPASSVSLSADGRLVAFAAGYAALPSDTNNAGDIYVFDRDAGDNDGLPDAWETTFGLNPSTAADANADADLDGVTNLQEFQHGSHPQATAEHTRYFAEGAANAFFKTRFAALNPGDTAATVVLRYLGQEGTVRSHFVTMPPKSRATVLLDGNTVGIDGSFSTVVESNHPVVVDRTMTWGFGTEWGGHGETSLAAPSTTWHLAEGATHGAFDLFYLLQNPNPTPATVTVTYLRLDPATPIVKTYDVPSNSRRTIWVDDEGPELAAADVGASITSDLPIVVERAMYSTRTGQPAFAAGHGGAGVTAPAPRWFLAEGATGQFFDLYVLIANPGTTASDVTVTYLLGNGGDSFSKTYTVGGQTRKTLSIKDEDPRLADTAVSMIVETTNNQPLVVERAMWWPREQWYEAHLSAGATTTGTRWALADGEVADGTLGVPPTETYILIANTSATDGSATVTLFRDFGGEPIVRTVPLRANSRVNVPVSELLTAVEGTNVKFGAIIESSGVEIVVERAMYQTTGGVTWDIGTVALATKLP